MKLGARTFAVGKGTLIILDIQKFLIHHIDARSLAKIQGDWIDAWFKKKDIGLMPLRTHQFSNRNHLFLCSHSDCLWPGCRKGASSSVCRALTSKDGAEAKLPKSNKKSKTKPGSERQCRASVIVRAEKERIRHQPYT